MAALDDVISRQLFHELKQQYPEIPDYKVTEFMIQNSNNKGKCLEVLAVESPKYMFGEYSIGAASVNQNLAELMDVENSQERRDSVSSANSNASTGSLPSQGSGHVASLAMAWPPNVNSNHNQGSSASSGTDFSTLPNPVSGSHTSDFSQFMAHGKSATQIPNIQCNTQKFGPTSHVVSSIGVPIQNYSSPWMQRKLYNTPENDTVVTSVNQVQNVVTAVGANASHNINSSNNNMVSSGPIIMGSSSGQLTGVPSFSLVSPHHMSKATIYIQNQRPKDGHSTINPTCMSSVAIQPQLQINQPVPSPQGSQIPVHHFSSNQFVFAAQRGEGKPQPAPRPSVMRNQNPPQPQLVKVYVSPVSSPTGGINFTSANSPPNFDYDCRYNPPDLPVRRDVMASPGVPTMTYPVNTAFQSSTASIPRTSSIGSAQGEAQSNGPYQMTTAIYPVSLQSVISTSSPQAEDSPHRERSRRSASREEEKEYIQALLSHQYVRKEKLEADLEKEISKLEKMRSQVAQLEKNMADGSSDAFPLMEVLIKLSESNRKLKTEIQCMTREVDMFNQGRTPLGVWNQQDEMFYAHLDQGSGVPMPNVGVGVTQRRTPPRSSPQRPSDVTRVPQTTNPPLPPNPPPRPVKVPPRPPLPQITSVPPVPPSQPHVSSGDSEEGEQWSCSACTFLNHPALNKCECCEMPKVTLGSR